jgi:thioredoxin reductase
MRDSVEVVIIGAGPYGLSLAAHLHATHVGFRIFGTPMKTWTEQMPAGMCLKSEGFASTLYAPGKGFTLEEFCEERGEPYAALGLPVKLETFVAYGQEFQKRMVPELEKQSVTSLERAGDGFQIQLDNGETVFSEKVVVAVGISHFQYLPPHLRNLPSGFVTHSSQHSSVAGFAGKDVTVLGAGASAMDLAALLHRAGARVHVIARRPVIRFHNPPGKQPRPLLERIKAPMTGLGPGWRSLLCVKAPLLFHKMPLAFRLEVVSKHLGPAPAWFTKDVVVNHVDLNVSSTVEKVEEQNGRLRLLIKDQNQSYWLDTDHLIAATGYQVDMSRLGFIHPELAARIRTVAGAPALSDSFQSSVKGLYFTGAAAAPSFGPLLRFAYGAGFTTRRLSRHLTRTHSRSAMRMSDSDSELAAG